MIQFRPSGIRIKRPDVFSTLVALVQTQIIGKYKRRLTIKEAGKLQSFTDNFIFHEKDHISYRQLGNSVNVRILYELGLRLFSNVFINELYITNKEQLVDLVYSLIDAKKKSDNFSDAIIADYLGMTRQSYQTIKNRKSFGIDILFKILKLLNCDLKIHFNSKIFPIQNIKQ
ncbi:DNA cytosine methyltransferase [Mycoplasmopsis bovis]|nr:DNA cytosine methyltransferase [Mycoplasmopsis bovis]WHL49562.1 DNA cytosine methyltransferase [Mycoplasmopsis bovis]